MFGRTPFITAVVVQILCTTVAVKSEVSDEFWSELVDLRNNYDTLTQERDLLRQDNGRIGQELYNLKQKQVDVQQLQRSNDRLKQEIDELHEKFNNLKGESSYARDSLVSFTAYNGRPFHSAVVNGFNIPFPNIINNDGGHYNSSSSTFTCPVHGLYHFSASVLSYYTFLDYQLNVGPEVAATARAQTSNDWGSASVVAVTDCDVGEEVSVVSLVSGQMYGFNFSSFNGYLISEISEGATLVGFTAENSLPDYPDVYNGSKIQFPTVVWNDGGHYDPDNSTFTCPTDGLYYFSTTILANGETLLDFYLSVDGRSVAESRAHTFNDWGSASPAATLFCRADQQVSVVSRIDGRMYGRNFCSFTGFLIATPENSQSR